MSERFRAMMVFHGALIFLVGMAAGFPFAFVILEKVALWPIEIDWKPPGDVRGWRMAHLEGVLNGLTLIAVGAAGNLLTLGERGQKVVAWGLIITSWGNITASVIGPIIGKRGLELGDGPGNSTVFLLFMVAIFAVITAMAAVARGAYARMKDADGGGSG